VRGMNQRPGSRVLMEALMVLAIIVAAAFSATELAPRNIAPGVGKVKDGDSFVLRGKGIRLFGIDAPEYRQTCDDAKGRSYDCGKEAAKVLRELIRGRKISCLQKERDRYRRSVAVCRNGDVELNQEMVRLGWAIAYRRHSFSYVAAEREARKNKRGIWVGTFVVPEDYRNQSARKPNGAQIDEGEE
jgi:endonuclease YncB( thermonuclease family)